NKFVALGYFFGRANLEVRDLKIGKVLFRGTGHTSPPVAMAFSPDGKYLATGDSSQSDLIVWDLEKKNVTKRINSAHSGSIQCLVFSPDGKFLFSGSSDRTVKIWKCADLK